MKGWMTAKQFETAVIKLWPTWAAAARRLNLSYQHLYRLRRGETPVPRQTADLLRCWLVHGVPQD
jgi:hypothetical protein